MTTHTSTPAASALRDQADAAAREAAAAMSAAATAAGGRIGETVPTGPAARLLRRMLERALRGEVGLCEHAAGAGPQPLGWLAWRPATLRCLPCSQTAAAATRGTREDLVCDGCRRPVPSIYSGAVMLPGAVVDVPGLLAGLGPVLVMFGLCRRCHATAGLSGEST